VLPAELTTNDLSVVHRYLQLADHKIRILDLSSVDQKHIHSIIKLLNHPTTNFTGLDIVNFGSRALHQKEFIFFGKWLLRQFSNRNEENQPKILKYL